ncbi:hypothetical protein ACS0TY_020740 [Phlomoides rotata]
MKLSLKLDSIFPLSTYNSHQPSRSYLWALLQSKLVKSEQSEFVSIVQKFIYYVQKFVSICA